MKALGIGVRVWVGWTSNDRVACPSDPRLREATIIKGPFEPGETLSSGNGMVLLAHRMWNIQYGDGCVCGAREERLFPIDDDPDAITEPTEQEIEA